MSASCLLMLCIGLRSAYSPTWSTVPPTHFCHLGPEPKGIPEHTYGKRTSLKSCIQIFLWIYLDTSHVPSLRRNMGCVRAINLSTRESLNLLLSHAISNQQATECLRVGHSPSCFCVWSLQHGVGVHRAREPAPFCRQRSGHCLEGCWGSSPAVLPETIPLGADGDTLPELGECRAGPDTWWQCGAGSTAVGSGQRWSSAEDLGALLWGLGEVSWEGSQPTGPPGKQKEKFKCLGNGSSRPFNEMDWNKRVDWIPDAQIRLVYFHLHKHTEGYQMSCYCSPIKHKGTSDSTCLTWAVYACIRDGGGDQGI